MSIFNRLTGTVEVEQRANTVVIKGISGYGLSSDLAKVWKTSRLSSGMISNESRFSVSFNAFMVPDYIYVMGKLLADRKIRTATPRRVFATIISQLETNTWWRSTTQPHRTRLNPARLSEFTVRPMPHQTEFFKVYDSSTQRFRLNGFLLAAAAGSGKTLISNMLNTQLEVKTQIYIVPKNSVVDVWSATFDTYFKIPPKYWTSLQNTPLTTGYSRYVFHYERMAEALEFVKANSRELGTISITLDECHNLNEENSQRSKLFVELCRVSRSRDILWMSGTPLKAMGSEVIPMLRCIAPDFDQDAEERYRAIYGKSSSRGLDILAHRLGLMMHRVESAQAFDNRRTTERVDVTMPDGADYTLPVIRAEMVNFIEAQYAYYTNNRDYYQAIYDKCISTFLRTCPSERQSYEVYRVQFSRVASCRGAYDLVKEDIHATNRYERETIIPALPSDLKAEFKDAKSVIKYTPLKVRGEALGRVLAKRRAQCHVDMIPYIGLPELIDRGIKKTVIFTDFVSVVDATRDYLVKEGYKPLVVYGDTNAELPAIVAKFKSDPDANPLIATFKSLSTAVPLVMANQAILLNSPFRPHERIQATARVDRLGQDAPVFIYDVFLNTGAEPNISTRSEDILKECTERVAMMTGTAGVDDTVATESESLVGDTSHDLPEDVLPDYQGTPSPDTVVTLVEPTKPVYAGW